MTVTFHDLEILARTVYGEARGQPDAGQRAVAHTVINRWKSGKWFAGPSIASTATKPWQYSCWNLDDPNRAKILAADLATDNAMVDAVGIALRAIQGLFDPSNGATHYYAKSIAAPKWAIGHQPCASIGDHLFFKDIP